MLGGFLFPSQHRPFSTELLQQSLTLRNIHHRLEHQRHQHNEHHVVDEELGRIPPRRRRVVGNGIRAGIFARGRSRVSSGPEGRGGRGGESRIQGIQGVELAEEGQERSHVSLCAPAWRCPRMEEESVLGGWRCLTGLDSRRSGAERAWPIRRVIIAGIFSLAVLFPLSARYSVLDTLEDKHLLSGTRLPMKEFQQYGVC